MKGIYPTQIQEEESDVRKNLFASFKKISSSFDLKINSAVNNQKKILGTKEIQLKRKIHLVRLETIERLDRMSQLEKEFSVKCEGILKAEIFKWNNYHDFYQNLLSMYEQRLEQQRIINQQYRQKICTLNTALRHHFRNQLTANSFSLNKNALNSQLNTQSSTLIMKSKRNLGQNQNRIVKQKRIKTECSLPSLKLSNNTNTSSNQLENKIDLPRRRLRTTYEEDSLSIGEDQRNYMEPIGKRRQKENSCFSLLIEFFEQFKKQKQKQEVNWFEKVILNERHYQKLMTYFRSNNIARKIRVPKPNK